jgi:hypothetical protein
MSEINPIKEPIQDPELNVESTDSVFERLKEEKQREFDQLSLELLSNASHYKKYMTKHHPETRKNTERDSLRFHSYRPKIEELLQELLDDYDELGTTSVVGNTNIQRIFKECIQQSITFIEWRDMRESDNEDEVLFGKVDDDEIPPARIHNPTSTSFWGRKIQKYSNSSATDRDMDVFGGKLFR